MGHPDFTTIPVGEHGEYAVQRTHNGEVSYLASQLAPSQIGRYSLGLAQGTCIVLRNTRPIAADDSGYRWLPWPTDHLPYKQAASMMAARYH